MTVPFKAERAEELVRGLCAVGDRSTLHGQVAACRFITDEIKGMSPTYVLTDVIGNLAVCNPAAASMFPSPPVLFMAHYDTVPGTQGADDNASGVALMLMLMSRYFSGAMKPPAVFLFTNNEEPPHFAGRSMGSKCFFESTPPETFKYVVNLDCVGFYGGEFDSSAIYGADTYDSSFHGKKASFLYLEDDQVTVSKFLNSGLNPAPVPPGSLLSLSDARNVVGHVPVVHVSDVAIFGDNHYHSKGDTPDTLDYVIMAGTAEAVYRSIFSRQGELPCKQEHASRGEAPSIASLSI